MASFILLFILFAIEGLGLHIPRQTILLAYVALPSILFSLHFIKKRTIVIPFLTTLLAVFYLIGANIAFFFFSLDKQTSFEYFLFSLSLFLMFVYFYNNREEAQRKLYILVGALGILFTVYSRLTPFFIKYQVQALIPFRGWQVVFPTYTTHNHLGDFLGMLLVLLAVIPKRRGLLFFLIPFFGTFFFLLTAGSRSAYLAFFIVAILYFIRCYKTIGRKYLLIGFASLGVILITVFLSLLPYAAPSAQLTKAAASISKFVSFAPRDFFSNRDVYYSQALSSIRQHPLGIGGGNFRLASYRYTTSTDISDSAHNIFLEQATENGVPAAFFLLLLIFILVAYAVTRPSPAGFLFIYLILNFQTDYTYQICLFPVIAVMAATVFYKEKNELTVPSVYPFAGSLLLLLLVGCITLSSYFVSKSKYETAVSFYPLNKEAYVWLIIRTKGDDSIVKRGLFIAPDDNSILYAAAVAYYNNGQKKKALPLYEKAYAANHLLNFEMATQLYFLKKELRPKTEASEYLYNLFNTYNHMNAADSFVKEINAFCTRIGKAECKQAGWDK